MVLINDTQVDLMLGFRIGKSKKLAQQGKIPYITLPDGSMRFDKQAIEELIHPEKSKPAKDLQREHLAVETSKEIYNVTAKLSKNKS